MSEEVKFEGHIDIRIEERGVITVEGVKISLWAIHNGLHNPPSDCLFAIRRDGEHIVFTRYETADAAAKFFANAS